MNSFREVCEDLGIGGEYAVAELIRQRGHVVHHDGGNHYHDLIINGSTTIEVKTALPTMANGNRHDRWQFNLYKNDGQHAPMEEDVLILRCQPARNDNSAWHFIIPGCLLPRNLTNIDITQDPNTYRGKYSLFLEAWELLDAIVALRDHNGVQVTLPGIPF